MGRDFPISTFRWVSRRGFRRTFEEFAAQSLVAISLRVIAYEGKVEIGKSRHKKFACLGNCATNLFQFRQFYEMFPRLSRRRLDNLMVF